MSVLQTFSIACVVLGATVLGRAAHAAGSDEAVWREECSACHIAYPARFLPARSWQQVMSTLDQHFGVDASVDAATAARIEQYLTSVARPSKGTAADPPIVRITESRWFVREHDEISPQQWRSPTVKSAANCAACHQDAAAGRFSEHSLRGSKRGHHE